MVGHTALDRGIGVRIPVSQLIVTCAKPIILASCAFLGFWSAITGSRFPQAGFMEFSSVTV